MTKTVYLSGPISGLTDVEACRYRNRISALLADYGLDSLDPMRGDYHVPGEVIGNFVNVGHHDNKAIVMRDRHDVFNCDLMIADLSNATKVSIGTMVEFGWADSRRVPIITVMRDGNPHNHAFVEQLSTYVVDDVETAVHLAATLLNV